MWDFTTKSTKKNRHEKQKESREHATLFAHPHFASPAPAESDAQRAQ